MSQGGKVHISRAPYVKGDTSRGAQPILGDGVAGVGVHTLLKSKEREGADW